MEDTDITIINTADDESLADYFQQKTAGDKCSVTVSGRFMGLEEGNARISIDEVELTAMPKADEEEDSDEGMTGAEMVLGETEDE